MSVALTIMLKWTAGFSAWLLWYLITYVYIEGYYGYL